MKFEVDKQDQYCTVTLKEEKLNSLIAPDLKSEIVVLNNEGIKNMILDLSEVKYADSSGLSSILVANRLCKNSNGKLVLTGLQENVSKLIKISQLDSILHITENVGDAADLISTEKVN